MQEYSTRLWMWGPDNMCDKNVKIMWVDFKGIARKRRIFCFKIGICCENEAYAAKKGGEVCTFDVWLGIELAETCNDEKELTLGQDWNWICCNKFVEKLFKGYVSQKILLYSAVVKENNGRDCWYRGIGASCGEMARCRGMMFQVWEIMTESRTKFSRSRKGQEALLIRESFKNESFGTTKKVRCIAVMLEGEEGVVSAFFSSK